MIGDPTPVHDEGNVQGDLPINSNDNLSPPGIDHNAASAPMQNGSEVQRSLSLEPAKIAKGILKTLNSNRVLISSGVGLGVMALGAGLMISFAFVPSVGIGLVIGGALLASAGAVVGILAPLLDPVVDKGIDKVIEGSKMIMDAIRKNPKLADIREKFKEYAASCCESLYTRVDDLREQLRSEVNDERIQKQN